MRMAMGRGLALVVCGWLAAGVAFGDDYFLTIGGGYDPQGNQISLERNVEFFRQVLDERRPDHPSHTLFFADGSDTHRDLQFRDPDFECSPSRRIAIELFGDVDDIDISYRNHRLPDVTGSTSPQHVRDYLSQLGRKMHAGDRLIVYSTAHGGSGEEATPYNTSLYTWNHRRFRATEFADWLNRLPQDTPVVMVMVQCYAGGFAHTIFADGDPKKGLATQLRAGFYAQVHDRPAAGCTPDVKEADYQEYSSFFWAALAGHDRSGESIGPVDIDGDGTTSFAEAHAYAVCHSETIDIPVRTSDAFLDYFSTDGTTINSTYHEDHQPTEPRRLPITGLLKLEGNFGPLLAEASPIDRSIIDQLAEKLSIDLRGDVKQLDETKDRLNRQLQRARRTASRVIGEHRRALDRVRDEVRREWPELDAELSPLLASLMAERSEEFESKVTAMRSYQSLTRLAEQKETANQAVLDGRKDEALALRMEQMLKRVVLEANLPKIASTQVVNRYHELLALESSGLVDN